jgi:hypothetical protein
MRKARPVCWCQRANGPLMARKADNYIAEIKPQTRSMLLNCRNLRSGRRESNPHDQLGRLELYH